MNEVTKVSLKGQMKCGWKIIATMPGVTFYFLKEE